MLLYADLLLENQRADHIVNRMKKEKKRWDVNDALENVDVADCALQARKEGYDLGNAQKEGDGIPDHQMQSTELAENPILDNGSSIKNAQSQRHAQLEHGSIETRPIDDPALQLERVATVP